MKFDVGIVNNQPVPTIVKQAKLAEDLGYETVWITDSHLICRELWVTLAACALGTTRIKLGTGVTVPHTRHWSVAASAIASLEELAPGRVILGIGTGGSSAETMGLSVQRAARLATLDTMVTSIRRLLAGRPAPLDSGIDARLGWLDGPRRVPIYVAGSGPRMLEAAGRLGDGAIMYAGTDPAILKAGLECVARGAAQQGQRPAHLGGVAGDPAPVDRAHHHPAPEPRRRVPRARVDPQDVRRRGDGPPSLNGSNSSTALPDGSSTSACWPPLPMTMSLRNLQPAPFNRSTAAARSSTSSWMRFQPPGSGMRASGVAWPAPPAPGRLSSRRRPPRESRAKPGAGWMSSVNPRCSV